MNRSGLETLVGLVVLAVAGVFVWFAVASTGTRVGGSGYEVGARFDRVDGISVGSDVRVAGVKVGSVTKVTLDPSTYQVEVSMGLPATVKLPNDSVAQITSDGLLGGRYVSLVPGADDAMLKPGERLRFTQSPVDIMQLVSRFMFSSGSGDATPATPKP